MTKIESKEILIIPIKDIKLNPKNRNKHPKEQIERLVKIIEYQGFRTPVTISNRTGLLVAGHGRIMAAKKLGYKEVPAIFQDFESEEQEIAHGVSDNAIAFWSELDMQGINADIPDLGPDFNIDLLGIKNFTIDVAEKEPGCDEDEVPEKVEPKAKLGDIYQLGNHRLMCGDSTSIDAVEKLMNGEKADMVFTSPPYNANTKAGQGDIFNGKKSKKLYDEGYSDNLESNEYLDFVKSVLNICFTVTDGFIFWNVSYNANARFEYIAQIVEHLPNLIEQICWKKTSTIPFKGSLMRDWEPIYLFSTNGQKLGLDEVVSNHWIVSNQNAQHENHKACFPVELPEKGIKIVQKKNGVIFEPFCGSGTTLIAAEKNERSCYAMELDPKYCDIIVARWEKYTGQKAVLLNEIS